MEPNHHDDHRHADAAAADAHATQNAPKAPSQPSVTPVSGTAADNSSPNAMVTDALQKWGEENAGPQSAGLQVVRVDQDEKFFIPFTTSVTAVALHYVQCSEIRGYVQCNGDECLLCRVGLHKEPKDLLPVYDVVAREVVVLPVSPSLRPRALRPQLLSILRQLQALDGPLLFSLRKETDHSHYLTVCEVHPGLDDGGPVIKQFAADLSAGKIDLTSGFARHTNDELSQIDEISRRMAARGISK
jgi:hypothetical protein